MSKKGGKNEDFGNKTMIDLERDLAECKRELPRFQKLYSDIGKALSASLADGNDDPFQGHNNLF